MLEFDYETDSFMSSVLQEQQHNFTFSEEEKKSWALQVVGPIPGALCKKAHVWASLFHLGHKVHSRVLAATCLYLIWLHR